MTVRERLGPLPPIAAARPAVIVWIDAEEATLVRWDGTAHVERIAAEIPSRHGSTGNVRHDPLIRMGGGGAAQDRIARDRAGHLQAFVEQVADAIRPDEMVEVVGPAGVRDELVRILRADDSRKHRHRIVSTATGFRLTERQLVARLRERIGDAPRRVQRGPEHLTDRPGPA